MTATLAETGRALAEGVLQGDRRALARAISAVENRAASALDLMRVIDERCAQRRAGVVGVTGPPGAGKSTLVSCMVAALLDHGRQLGVLLVDPSSPFSGGAVLGDRVRMKRRAFDERLYVRSVGARGHGGALSGATATLVRLLDGWGADVVLVETVGAGQSEVEVASIADVTVVVCPPGLGDALQAMKAGAMEIADVFVVNKADRPGAGDTASSLADAGVGGVRREHRPVLQTVATTGKGVNELLDEVEGRLAVAVARRVHPARSMDAARAELAARAAGLAQEAVTTSSQDEIGDLVTAVRDGHVDIDTAAWLALRFSMGGST